MGKCNIEKEPMEYWMTIHLFGAGSSPRCANYDDYEQEFVTETANLFRNPAYEASRGLSAEQLVHNSRWLTGPAFMWETEIAPTAKESCQLQLPSDDPEVKKAWTHVT